MLFAFLLLISPVLAYTDGTHMKFVASLPINTYHNYVYNGTLYSQEGYMTRMYDLSPGVDRTKITQRSFVNQVKVSDTKPNDYTVYSGKLYILSDAALDIFDVSTPYKQLFPVFLGNTSSGGGTRIVINGNLAYITSNGIKVIDISDPATPVLISHTTARQAQQIAFDGRYAYTGFLSADIGDTYFTTWDMIDPHNPVIVNSTQFTTLGVDHGLKAIGYYNNFVYLTSYTTTVQAWNVTNRSAPVRTTVINQYGVNLKVYDHYLLVSFRYNGNDPWPHGGVGVWDISNGTPSTHVVTQSEQVFFGYTEDVSTDGTTIAVSGNTCGEWLLDFTNKTQSNNYNHPTLNTALSLLGVPATSYALNAYSIGNLDILASAGRDGGTWYWNITNPADASSRALAFWTAYGIPRQQCSPVYKNYSYVSWGTNSLNFGRINLTGIESPTFIPVIDNLYVSGYYESFIIANETRIYDSESDKISTGRVSSWHNDNNNVTRIRARAYDNNFLALHFYNNTVNSTRYLLASNWFGIKLFDITEDNLVDVWNETYNASNPSTFHAHYGAYDPVTNHLYAPGGTGAGGFYVKSISLSDINNIQVDGMSPYMDLTMNTQPNNIIANNGTDVFVIGISTGGSDVYMFDFSNPSSPKLIDGVKTGGANSAIAYYKGYLYVGNEGSITVWKVTPSSGMPQDSPIIPVFGSQNQQPEQQSNSSDHNIITQIAGIVEGVVNYFIRHFPIQI